MSAVKPLNPLKTPHFRTKYLGNDFILPRYKNAVASRTERNRTIYAAFTFTARRKTVCPDHSDWPRRSRRTSPNVLFFTSQGAGCVPVHLTAIWFFALSLYNISRFRQILGFQISQICQIQADVSRFGQILWFWLSQYRKMVKICDIHCSCIANPSKSGCILLSNLCL